MTERVLQLQQAGVVPLTGGRLPDAVASIKAALAPTPTARQLRRQLLDFVAAHDDALSRSCVVGHLTASALVVDAAREHVLLMLHAKLGMWLQPGGHADGEGHLATVALKEATEETGISGLRIAVPAVDCDVHTIPSRPGEPEHLHFDVRYVVIAPPSPVLVGNHESHALRWVSLEELDALATDDSLRRLAKVGLELALDV